MTSDLKKIIYLFIFLVAGIKPIHAQLGFVELRKEISCFDNTRCVSQEFTISLPYFDIPEKGGAIPLINDSVYRIASSILNDMNHQVQFQHTSWTEDKAGIDACESGINSSESRELYYSILYNENNILSFILRNDWIVEKQMILKSDFVTAEQQNIYCFSVDLSTDKVIDVNSLFKSEDRSKIIDMIRAEYELEYEEEMTKAGDRLRYCGLLLTPMKMIAAYTILLPDDQSEVRTVELQLNEVYDYMQVQYQPMLNPYGKE